MTALRKRARKINLALIGLMGLGLVLFFLWPDSAKGEETQLSEAERKELEAQEQPWPDYVTIHFFKNAGGFAAIEFLKFSIRPSPYYDCHLVFTNLIGWENLPKNGWLRDAKTNESVMYGIETTDFASFVSQYGITPVVAEGLQKRLNQDDFFYTGLPKAKALVPEFQSFMDSLGEKLPVGGLEIIEHVYVPPVARVRPLNSTITRMSPEQFMNRRIERKRRSAYETK